MASDLCTEDELNRKHGKGRWRSTMVLSSGMRRERGTAKRSTFVLLCSRPFKPANFGKPLTIWKFRSPNKNNFASNPVATTSLPRSDGFRFGQKRSSLTLWPYGSSEWDGHLKICTRMFLALHQGSSITIVFPD